MNNKQDMSGSDFISSYGTPVNFNWNSDECSAPIAGNSPWDFEWPCRRHDFGYRNLERGEGRFPAHDMWNVENKATTDRQFRDDLYLHCDLNFSNIMQHPLCDADAYAYHYAVSFYGDNTWGMERDTLYTF